MTINELNTKILIQNYTSVQDTDTGKISSTLTSSWMKWAKVEQLNGSRVLDNAAITYKEAFKFTTRYEGSRKTLNKYKVEYKQKALTVHSVIKEYEGAIWWEVITAYNTIQ